ncbi:hypothetical protein CDLVIII_3201 [Clostridium sp. DL-VIII]|uniref:toll/interleukin-1 receptor domain-containing protein n=1 Tax=Clostridium sp. DL-VIII TaxID=641107 RepID=UPI00023AFFCE|nr:toll/interleukin-1 receptor domain-containing protein [Clostridium sp. DL-VIII]EHI99775.1 hypothetical protein CDLVIII_3201 [Clostridium sp. DL-VIII]
MKPTIFFSHSSKDRDSLMKLRELIEEKTGGTINIFMSSDGQSIPFGSNWMYKIEEGLKDAKIMFVFVTPKSIDTGWIYFEAGYAYSKGIEVIPIGINIDIGSIKPPISLLQGFNLISEESINNIIHIINKKFDYSIKANFSRADFNQINYRSDETESLIGIKDSVDYITTNVFSYKTIDKEVSIDCKKLFEQIKDYLAEKNVEFVSENNNVLANGLKLYLNNQSNQLEFKMDAIGFFKQFALVNDIIKMCYEEKDSHFIIVRTKNNYKLLNDVIKVSSKIINNREFSISKRRLGGFNYKQYEFVIENEVIGSGVHTKEDIRIRIIYPTDNFDVAEILELINKLKQMDIIEEI